MTTKRTLGLLLALFALMAVPATTLAQDIATEAAATDTATPKATDDQTQPALPWLKFCGTLEDGRKLCLIRQLVYAQSQLLASFIIRNNPAEESPLMLMAAMPNGVMLPYGLRIQIDSGRELILPFVTCDSSMCNTRTVINESFINSLKRGAILKLMAKSSRGVEITIEIDLKGFTATYDGDEYVSLDSKEEDSDAASKLGQAVQDLAEQMRRQQDAAAAPADEPAAGN
jgi:invasion protein IalB